MKTSYKWVFVLIDKISKFRYKKVDFVIFYRIFTDQFRHENGTLKVKRVSSFRTTLRLRQNRCLDFFFSKNVWKNFMFLQLNTYGRHKKISLVHLIELKLFFGRLHQIEKKYWVNHSRTIVFTPKAIPWHTHFLHFSSPFAWVKVCSAKWFPKMVFSAMTTHYHRWTSNGVRLKIFNLFTWKNPGIQYNFSVFCVPHIAIVID